MTTDAKDPKALIGARIAARRTEAGLTQLQLGEALGVSYQQVHNYERGRSSVTAEKLHLIAMALRVEVAYFFVDLADPTARRYGGRQKTPERQVIDNLAAGPVGAEVSFPFGTFSSPKALKVLCRSAGADWFDVSMTAEGQVVRKVAPLG